MVTLILVFDLRVCDCVGVIPVVVLIIVFAWVWEEVGVIPVVTLIFVVRVCARLGVALVH